jgi:hypothetical protein
LEELVPRTDAGTHERRMEKKADAATTRASYREQKSPGLGEVAERELMGDDGIEAYKQKRKEEEMKKSQWAIRREEMDRARDEERKERVGLMAAKEEKTMDMLKELAKQRFG